jgi:predicted DNA-binding transcriptional regulator AlpA
MTHNTQRLLVDWKSLKALGWPYSRAHTWRLMEAAKFPQCIKLGGHRNSHPVWRMKDVIDHLELLGLVIREVGVAS